MPTSPQCVRGHLRLSSALCATLVVFGSSCATGAGDELGSAEGDGYQMVEPSLGSIAPTALALGDTVKVFGENFIPKEHGTLSLYLEGVYTDSTGATHPFEGEVVLDVENPSVASFPFEQIFFHPTRDKTGQWVGTASLVNRMPTEDDVTDLAELWSENQDVSLLVKPSIMATRLRSADATGCAPVTGATNGDHNLEVGFQAIGLGEATEESPWTIRVGFVTPEVDVYYVTPDLFNGSAIDVWPLKGIEGEQTLASPAPDGNNRLEFEFDSGSTVVLNPQSAAHMVNINPPAVIGTQTYDRVLLGKLATGNVEFGGQSTANILVEIFTADGRDLRRVMTMDVFSEFEIGVWDGDEFLAERYQAHATSGCITCSPNGPLCSVEYSEGQSLTRTRSVSVRWDTSVQQSLGFSAGNFNILQVNGSQAWTNSFGVDINESVSSEEHKNRSTSVQVIPSYAAMSYRQLERRVRSVDVVYHNACGASGVVGQAELTNWNFGFEVATGPDCDPATNLPSPEKND